MSPLDLIRSRDGSMSLTKCGALAFHASIAVTVAAITVVRIIRYSIDGTSAFDAPLFDIGMWTLWASVAVGHAVIDKSTAQVAAFKTAQLEVESGHGALGK